MSKRIIFFAPFGNYKVHHQLDAVVASALRVRGCEVKALTCDGFYPHCDVLTWVKDNIAGECANCAHNGVQLFSQLGVPFQQLQSCITAEDRLGAERSVDLFSPDQYQDSLIDGLPIGKWAISSIFSYFRINPEGLKQPPVQRAYRQFMINCLLTWRSLERISREFSPTHLVAFNARYGPYRVALEFGKAHGLPVIVHERGAIDDSFFLTTNHTCIESYPFLSTIAQWKDTPLDSKELHFVKQNFFDREVGKGSNFTPFINYQTDPTLVRRQLALPEGVPIISFFTSSEFELAYTDDFKGELSQTEIIARFAEILRHRNECLVLRHHPYIGGASDSPPDLGLLTRLKEIERKFPNNIRVISPSEILSSYALLSISSAVIAPLSTVAIEAIARGIPSACLPQSYYKDSVTEVLFDLTVTGISSTIDRLLQRNGMIEKENLIRAYRNHCAVTQRLSQRFKSFGIEGVFNPDIRINSLEQLLPGVDPALDRVCNFIIEGSSLTPVPENRNEEANRVAEDAFLTQELERVIALRRPLDTITPSSPRPRVCLIDLLPQNSRPAPEWIFRSRHQDVEILPFPHKQLESSSFAGLAQLAEQSRCEYFTVVSREVFLEEAFLSSCIDALASETDHAVIGVRTGGWFVENNCIFHGCVFSLRDPVKNRADLKGLKQILNEPALLLSFHLFRTKSVAPLFRELANLNNTVAIIDELLRKVEIGTIKPLSLQAACVETGSLRV